MQVTFDIPDILAAQFAAAGKDPAREALEVLAVDGYRNRTLFENDIVEMLGYQTRMQVHELLQQHGVSLQYDVEDFARDVATSDRVFGRASAV